MLVNIYYKFISSVLNILTGRNGLKVAKAGPNSKGDMGMMADSYVRLRGGGAWWLSGIMADWHNG